jgi:hypothetical protein
VDLFNQIRKELVIFVHFKGFNISEVSFLHISKHVCMNQYYVLLFTTNSGTIRKLLPCYIVLNQGIKFEEKKIKN